MLFSCQTSLARIDETRAPHCAENISVQGSRINKKLILELQTETLDRIGGADRDRTGDPLLAKQVLSQLSYSPDYEPGWWAWVESNYRPHPYQGCALTN